MNDARSQAKDAATRGQKPGARTDVEVEAIAHRAVLRFDMMRAPFATASTGELYRAAIEMAAWADSRAVGMVGFSEHHLSRGGFLPSPFSMAAAVAARSERISIGIAALLLNLYDPLHVAEQIATLDLVSQGRFSVTIGLGYREVEYRAFGADWDRRGALLEEKIEWLLRALRGERVAHRGVEIELEPLPASPLLGVVTLGGNSVPAARRAGRLGLVFCPSVDDTELGRAYREASERHGNGPGFVVYPNAPSTTLIDEDPDRAWSEIGPYLLHHAEVYGSWSHPTRRAYAVATGRTLDALRAEGKYRILTPEEAARALRETGSLHLAPITAGLSPDIGWRTLELFATKVEPAL
jgi:alkanesulfonate monooxygenase SsuD/methylene tetrahydromethanopterin reductase-like flavin-dependent oxidoreductase (luciferase family)